MIIMDFNLSRKVNKIIIKKEKYPFSYLYVYKKYISKNYL